MKKILVVEDENLVRKMIVTTLTSINQYEVQDAADGLQALLKTNQNKFDLIITDITMPNLDGFKLAKALKNREETKNIPIIFLTAKSDPQSVIEGINVGAKKYLNKPLSKEELLTTVGEVFNP